jgi:hypothetical protein
MRRISDILKDMGFNEGSSDRVQEAFVRHLLKHSAIPSQQNSSPISEQSGEEAQLSFDAEILGTATADVQKRKSKTR